MDDRGSVLLGGFVLVLVMTILGFGLFDLTVLESRLVIDRQARTQACNVAESALNRLSQDMGNGDGINDFAQVYALGNPTNVYTSAGFNTNNGIYTYTVTKVAPPPTNPTAVQVLATGTSPPTVTSSTGVQCVIKAVFKQQFGFPFALVGTVNVMISGGLSLVDSFNSATGPYASSADSNGDVRSSADITISNSTVKGDATAGGTVTNGGTVTGATTNSATPPVTLGPSPVAPCGPPFSSGSGITGGTYNSANGNLIVSGGGTATLANGTYCFNSIALSGGSKLVVNGPVVVYLLSFLAMSGGSIVNNTLNAANLQLLSSGTGQGTISLSGGSGGYMTIYAPGTEVDLSGGSEVFGAIVGSSVNISGDSKVHLDKALNNSPGLQGGVVTATVKRESWTLVQN